MGLIYTGSWVALLGALAIIVVAWVRPAFNLAQTGREGLAWIVLSAALIGGIVLAVLVAGSVVSMVWGALRAWRARRLERTNITRKRSHGQSC